MSDVRVLTTRQLIKAVTVGIDLNMNQQLELQRVKNMADKDGFHVFEVILPFHNLDNSSPMHHRVEGLIKVTGTNEGVEVIFDVPTELWESYMTPTVFSERVGALTGVHILDVSANA